MRDRDRQMCRDKKTWETGTETEMATQGLKERDRQRLTKKTEERNDKEWEWLCVATQLILVPEGEVCNQSQGQWVLLLKFKFSVL